MIWPFNPRRVFQTMMRIALAQLRHAESLEEGLAKVEDALGRAARRGAAIVCFPECYLPGLRGMWLEAPPPPPDQAALEDALARAQAACRAHKIAAILGTEWQTAQGLQNRAWVISPAGRLLGSQTKNQLPPDSESEHYVPGIGRSIFRLGELTFGISICHEGWRYPETVRWAVRHGARLVFQPQVTISYQPLPARREWGRSFFEKTMQVRAAENTIWLASVNQAHPRQNCVTSLIAPDGSRAGSLGRNREGLLVADIDLDQATRLYARRLRPELLVEA